MKTKNYLAAGFSVLLILSLLLASCATPRALVNRGALLCATEAGNCVESWNGSDIIVYSDVGSTQTFLLDGATGNATVGGALAVVGATTFADGTVSAPSIAFTSDSNTGAYLVAADNPGISAYGVLVSDWLSVSMDMNSLPILNIGASGTDFSATGGLALADDLDMSAQPIVNIGNAGTDFGTGGGLTLAAPLLAPAGAVGAPAIAASADTDTGLYTVAANDLGVAAHGVLVSDWTSVTMDMNSLPIVNIGAAGTDFSATGGLTLADDLDMSNEPIVNIGAAGTDFTASGGLALAAGLDVAGGDITMQNDETLSNAYNGVITATATTFYVAGALGTSGTGSFGGNVILQNDESFDNSYDGVITATATTFYVDGALTSSGAADIGGDITLENDETLSNAYNGSITATVAAGGEFNVATGNLTVGDASGADWSLAGGDAYVNDTLEVDGNTRVDGTLTLEAIAFSGPIVFGAASAVVTGTTIAHGLGITPTSIALTPAYAGAFTNTVYVRAADATNITVGLGYTTGVTTVTTVYWFAGK